MRTQPFLSPPSQFHLQAVTQLILCHWLPSSFSPLAQVWDSMQSQGPSDGYFLVAFRLCDSAHSPGLSDSCLPDKQPHLTQVAIHVKSFISVFVLCLFRISLYACYFLRIQKLRDGFLVFFRLNVAALKVVKMNKNATESRRGLCSMLCT